MSKPKPLGVSETGKVIYDDETIENQELAQKAMEAFVTALEEHGDEYTQHYVAHRTSNNEVCAFGLCNDVLFVKTGVGRWEEKTDVPEQYRTPDDHDLLITIDPAEDHEANELLAGMHSRYFMPFKQDMIRYNDDDHLTFTEIASKLRKKYLE